MHDARPDISETGSLSEPSQRHWQFVGVSVQGASHKSSSIPCQDSNRIVELPNGTLIAAIADGAGSASHSHEASVLAVDVATKMLQDRFAVDQPPANDDEAWRLVFMQCFEAARNAIESWSAEHRIQLRDLATTLTCAVVNEKLFAIAQVGDGFGVVRDPHGDLTTVSVPARGEYANETTFITGPDALAELEVLGSNHPIDALVLSTDGLLRLAFKLPSLEPHLPFFGPILEFVEALDERADRLISHERMSAFLDSDRVNSRTDDDKTLVIAIRARTVVRDDPPSSSTEDSQDPDTDAASDATAMTGTP